MRHFRKFLFAFTGVLMFAVAASTQTTQSGPNKAESMLAKIKADRAQCCDCCDDCQCKVCVCEVNHAKSAKSAPSKASAMLAKAAQVREGAVKECASCLASAALSKCKLEREDQAGCLTDLVEAQTKAKKSTAPLFVWIGMTCDVSVRKAFPEAVHVHVEAMNGGTFPRLVVQKASNTETWRFFKADISPSIIQPVKEWLAPVKTPTKTSYAPIVSPLSAPVCVT